MQWFYYRENHDDSKFKIENGVMLRLSSDQVIFSSMQYYCVYNLYQ